MINNKIIGFCILLAATGLAYADAGKEKAGACASCHGEDGNASVPIFPKLAGQHASYLAKQLSEFKSQKRIDSTMNAMSAGLSDADITDLAKYYANAKIKAEKASANAWGDKIFRAGDQSKSLPSCASCHGLTGAGNPFAVYPALGGQFSAYIDKTLHDYKSGERKNDPNGIMRSIASRLTDEEMSSVADYLSGLK